MVIHVNTFIYNIKNFNNSKKGNTFKRFYKIKHDYITSEEIKNIKLKNQQLYVWL